MPINVVMCLWGDWPGTDFAGPEYINRLVRAIKRNTTLDVNFTALVEHFESTCCETTIDGCVMEPDIDVRPLDPPSWEGCLPKLAAFNPAYGFEGTVVVFDLDTIITGNIDHFLTYPGALATRMSFGQPGLSGGDCIAFQAGRHWDGLWDRMNEEKKELLKITEGGKERFVYRRWTPQPDFWSDLFPGHYVSYKRHVKQNNDILPPDARMVSCHGRNTGGPRQHHLLKLDWVREAWV